jgi:hypothetical protein
MLFQPKGQVKVEAIEKSMDNYESGMELTSSDEAPAEEAPKEEVPAEETPSEETPKDEEVKTEELFDLPDGRKVNAAGLKSEYENLLPEFTRKSQRLAEIERERDLNNNPKKDEPEWKNPDYVPKTYAELVEIATQEAMQKIQSTQKAEQDRITAIETGVSNELAELKKADPKLDENSLFMHANKYGFQDLKTAYANMSDMKKTAVEVEQRTVKNLKTREVDPISTGTGGESSDDSGYDPRKCLI